MTDNSNGPGDLFKSCFDGLQPVGEPPRDGVLRLFSSDSDPREKQRALPEELQRGIDRLKSKARLPRGPICLECYDTGEKRLAQQLQELVQKWQREASGCPVNECESCDKLRLCTEQLRALLK